MKRISRLACITVALSLLFVLAISSPVLAEDGRLFMIDGITNQILELNPDTGAVLNSFSTPYPSSDGPDGLAYGNGRMFYTASPGGPLPIINGEQLIYELNPENSRGEEQNDNGEQLIFELNPENGDVINSFPAPGVEIDALGFSCDRLFALDYVESTIYVLNPNTGAIITSFQPQPLVDLIGGGTFAGTRNSLFISGDAPNSVTIYELNPEDGTVLNSFLVEINTWGLGFSSSRNTLFIGEIGGTSIYEVNPDNGDIIDSFPVEAMITALAADECGPPPPRAVGGDVFPVNKMALIAPWIALGAIILAGGVILIRRQRALS